MSDTPRSAPISSVRSTVYDTGVETASLEVTEAWFPAGLRLPPHRHDRPLLIVVLEGSLELAVTNRRLSCPAGTVFTEPLGLRHAQEFESRGAHVVVLAPDPRQDDALAPCRDLFEEVRHFEHGGLTASAWRVARELRTRDALSTLAIQALTLDMLATAARLEVASARPPSWLATVEALLRADFREPVDIDRLAEAAGVHPTHLAATFREHHRVPLGRYARTLRLQWAATRLAASDDPISQIALEAGFADQSHFTRVFKGYSGLPPGRYRKALKG